MGREVTWWELAGQARQGNSQNCPRPIALTGSDDFTLYRIHLRNAGQFHPVFANGDGFPAWGVVINTPKKAHHTGSIDPSAAKDVTIAHCFIGTGDDNVAIKAGGHVSAVTIADNHFYAGHGMSAGSETNGGAERIRVTGVSIDGTGNGIRIKSNSSRGGLVTDVVYEDVCIRNTKHPIYGLELFLPRRGHRPAAVVHRHRAAQRARGEWAEDHAAGFRWAAQAGHALR